jgi:hypothetical protein
MVATYGAEKEIKDGISEVSKASLTNRRPVCCRFPGEIKKMCPAPPWDKPIQISVTYSIRIVSCTLYNPEIGMPSPTNLYDIG